ncbi:MAG: LptA/OstA family protein [Pseudomonadota bacterium]
MKSHSIRCACVSALAGLALLMMPAAELKAQSTVTDLQGLAVSSDLPVSIDADRLEVFDDQQMALFSGNVKLRQGEVSLQTSTLEVHYSGGAREQQGSITRLEAKGKVLVQSEDQTATGDRAVFDVATRTIRVLGSVVLSQGQNVIRGNELVVDLESGRSRLVANRSGQGQRVQGVFMPNSVRNSQ